jgi:hypothetical protein
MTAALTFLTRLFLFTSCLFGAAMGLTFCFLGLVLGGSNGIVAAVLVGAAAGAGAGLLYGLPMTLTCGLWHIHCVRRLGFPLTEENLAVRQRRSLTIDVAYDEAFRLCTEAVRRLGRAHVSEETDYNSGVILSVKGATWRSWGEKIRFDLRELGGRTEVFVECRPLMRTAIADFGASLRNMDAIMGFLVAHGATGEGRPTTALAGHVSSTGFVQPSAQGADQAAGVVREPPALHSQDEHLRLGDEPTRRHEP